MINSLLFSPAEANRLNNRVKTEIADHLLLFINFCPNYLIPPSADAKYRLAVDNLYSIFKDTAWIIRSFSEIFTGIDDERSSKVKAFSKDVDTKSISDIFHTISDLRTIQGHTSATTDIMLTGRCEHWFSKYLKYKKPQTTDDYEVLTKELKKFADIIVAECEKFIDKVKISSNKADIVRRWENAIIKRYAKNQDMFRLAVYKYCYSQNMFTSVSDVSSINGCVNKIISSYFYYDYCQLLEKAEQFSKYPKIKNAIKEQANALSTRRTDSLNSAISTLALTSLDDLRLKQISKEQWKSLIDYFFENNLETLIKEQLRNSAKKSLHIDNLVIEILDNTKNEIIISSKATLTLKMFNVNWK